MPIDEIGSGFINITFRLISAVVRDFIIDFVLYNLGFLILRVITFGQYPPGKLFSRHNVGFFQEVLCYVTPLIVAGCLYFFWVYY